MIIIKVFLIYSCIVSFILCGLSSKLSSKADTLLVPDILYRIYNSKHREVQLPYRYNIKRRSLATPKDYIKLENEYASSNEEMESLQYPDRRESHDESQPKSSSMEYLTNSPYNDNNPPESIHYAGYPSLIGFPHQTRSRPLKGPPPHAGPPHFADHGPPDPNGPPHLNGPPPNGPPHPNGRPPPLDGPHSRPPGLSGFAYHDKPPHPRGPPPHAPPHPGPPYHAMPPWTIPSIEELIYYEPPNKRPPYNRPVNNSPLLINANSRPSNNRPNSQNVAQLANFNMQFSTTTTSNYNSNNDSANLSYVYDYSIAPNHTVDNSQTNNQNFFHQMISHLPQFLFQAQPVTPEN